MCKQLGRWMLLVFVLLGMGLTTVQAAVWPSGREVAPFEAKPFDLRDVQLLDGPFREAMVRTQKYLHELESDRLLWYFRETAGLPAPGAAMGGWERMELRGHSMGHYLSGCALIYASMDDEALKAKADSIVAELAKCQTANGNGYLSAYPESFIDRVIAQQRVWAPWYTLHKIYAGLIDMYVYCGNDQALEVAKGMAQWAKGRLDPLDREAMQAMLNRTEQGGMNEVLANLYGITGEQQWLDLSQRFTADRYNDPLILHRDELTGQHVNSFIPNMIGTARQYELTGDLVDRHIAEFFWDIVVHGRTYCTGGTSNHEQWRGEPYKLADQLSVESQESCCTYNMLKLTRHLFAWEPDAALMDYYEGTLINSILSTQDPNTGMCMYYVSMEPGHWKVFHTPRDSFWCCTGTGMENHAKYGDTIYFADNDTLWVNLFIASELNWRDKAIRIRQETSFPETPTTTVTVTTGGPVAFDLRIRIPKWATNGVTLKVNGQPQVVTAQPGSYASIQRTWSNGDKIELTMPMSLWICSMPDDANLAAVMYGPLVLAGELGDEGLTDEVTYLSDQRGQNRASNVPAPTLAVDPKGDPQAWLKPVAGRPLTFRTDGVGQPNDVTLVPFHRLFGERYTIYWRMTD